MALVELSVEWVDAAATRAMFVRCTREIDKASATSFLRLDLLCGPRIWRTDVHEKEKPTVLDCSAIEFLRALETAFTLSDNGQQPRFSFKWSDAKSTLTLSERATSGFAMKYATLKFDQVDAEEDQTARWHDVLHDIVDQSERTLSETTKQRQRIQELETMVSKKDALLETALKAKQRLEEELFTKFCAVLNGKKEEIERLQRELAMATAATSSKTAYKPSTAVKKRAPPGGRKKAVGAKLSKKTTKPVVSEEESEEEEEDNDHDDEDSESDSQSEHSGADDDDDDNGSPKKRNTRSRVKREAINAYSQLASQIPLSSQVCAAADVLDDLDEIMKTEVEHDDEQTASSRTTRKRPPPRSSLRPRSPEKKPKTEEVKPAPKEPTQTKAKPKAKPASPPKKPMDSEEEDILDMLS